MKHFTSDKKLAIQGDVAFIRVDELPASIRNAESQKAENGQLVVAHSETGHNHAFDANADVVLLQDPDDALAAYLQVNSPSELKHHRGVDPHEHIMFEPGIYKINRQREHTPEGWQRVAD